jgi:hypothetical protein
MYLKKEYIILIVIIIALSSYLVFHKENKTHYTLPGTGNFKQEEISELTLTKTTSGITLAREDNRWFIEPQHFPADSGKVDNMLNAVSGLKLTALVSESGNYTIYELDDTKRIQVRAFYDDTSLLSLDIGKPASSFRHTFVRLEHDHRVYHAEGNLRNIFDTTVSMLRDKDVLTFDEQVAEIYLKKGNDTLRLVRRDAPISVDMNQKPVEPPREPLNKWLTTDGQAVHDEEVDSMLSTLKNLTCDEFIEERNKEDFTDPVYTITLKGLKEYTVSLFEKTDSKYPAVSSENDYPFFLSDWKAEKIMKEFVDLTVSEEQR